MVSAVELTAGPLISAFLQALFSKIADNDQNMLDFIRGIKRYGGPNLLEKLKITLRSVDALANHAEELQFEDLHVRQWLNDLKDAIFEADDLIDEMVKARSRQILEAELGCGTSEVRCFSSASHIQLNERMKETLEKLEYLVKQKDILGLREGVNRIPSTKLQTSSLYGKSQIYGRHSDKEFITNLLLSDSGSDKICVLPIVGMGGVGKTTLAQLVYNDEQVKKHFDLKVWVCVTQEFEIFKLTKSMLEAIFPLSDTMDHNQQQIKLKELLENKKFLIVLDDVWFEDDNVWENLRRPLEFRAGGSKILVTTRSEKVASVMFTVPLPMHHLKPLTDDDCWSLFENNVFDGRKFYGCGKLENIGREIVKKFGGLPLAAKALAGVLRHKKDVNEWGKVLKSHIWDFSNGSSNVLPALMLSYHYLPFTLKRCFAYCSIFPKNYQFRRTEIVQLWMAEDLLQLPKASESLEEVGNDYFYNLVSRSFFQQSTKRHFVIHDLMIDLAELISGEFSFRLNGTKRSQMSQRIRHLSYSSANNTENIISICEAKGLRTFFHSEPFSNSRWLTNEAVNRLLSNLKNLRVLSFHHCRNLTVIPDCLGDLIHLKYLDLSNCIITKLPESTCSLYNLQTLRLNHCSHLMALPLNMGRLINLRFLELSGTNISHMPLHMNRLKNLQTLTEFILGNGCGSSIKDLKELSCLKGKLSISNLQNVVDSYDAMEANLFAKEQLTELVLKWTENADSSEEVRSILNQLEPPKNLEKLTINGYGSTSFPGWLGDCHFSSLQSISLSDCLNCISLPQLGHLPSLQSLSLGGFPSLISVGDGFYNSSPVGVSQLRQIEPFRSLLYLRFKNMPQWLSFGDQDTEGAFPRLQQLHLENCPKLMSLPQKLPSLTELVIIKCHELEATVPVTICKLKLEHSQKVSMRESLPQLQELSINESDALDLLLAGIDNGNSCIEKLKSLDITNCGNAEFPLNQCFPFLESLCIRFSCNSLISFIMDLFPKLSCLDIRGCQSLQSLSVSGTHTGLMTSLNSLRIRECPKFVAFLDGGLRAPNLTNLLIESCQNLTSLPHQMNNLLPSLVTLEIVHCPKLESFPECGLPKSLHSLKIFYCRKLFAGRKNWDLNRLSSLRNLYIQGTCKVGESFPEKWLLPSSLTYLSIHYLKDLKSLHVEGLQHLTSLEQLVIAHCSELNCMPEKLPCSLLSLHIKDCPTLERRCNGEKSEEWSKISHVPVIRINGKLIR